MVANTAQPPAGSTCAFESFAGSPSQGWKPSSGDHSVCSARMTGSKKSRNSSYDSPSPAKAPATLTSSCPGQSIPGFTHSARETPRAVFRCRRLPYMAASLFSTSAMMLWCCERSGRSWPLAKPGNGSLPRPASREKSRGVASWSSSSSRFCSRWSIMNANGSLGDFSSSCANISWSTDCTPCLSRYCFALAATSCFLESSATGRLFASRRDAVRLAVMGALCRSRLGMTRSSCLTVPPKAVMPARLTCFEATFLKTSTV
mmetsp:Transcript_51067/g.143761  ORF Transcript_51067/g.143761 Transcript_51067/m.143761 type:complete len:260 (+) Transcript_51067:2052-2831(+)